MDIDYTKLEKFIDKSQIRYNEEMKKHTTIKIGGNADVLVLPESVKDVCKILEFVKYNNCKLTIIGNGSKVLVKDEGIRGITMKIGYNMSNFKICGEYVYVDAGITLPKLSIKVSKDSLSGLEFAAGIPGAIGGSIYMNAGAYGSEMSNIVYETTYIDENLEIKVLKKDEHNFGYRKSFFRDNSDKNFVIISSTLKLEKSDSEKIIKKMEANNTSRKEKQPLEWPSAGSTFKRPEGYFVGKIIDDLNLKGKTIGGAQVSTKHSGFIINKGNATAQDVLDLIELIQKEAKKKFNVDLETEILVIGG